MIASALAVGALALIVASFTLWGNARARDERGSLRRRLDEAERELDRCGEERDEFRRQLEVVKAALISMLPEGKRLELLHHLEETMPPPLPLRRRGAA